MTDADYPGSATQRARRRSTRIASGLAGEPLDDHEVDSEDDSDEAGPAAVAPAAAAAGPAAAAAVPVPDVQYYLDRLEQLRSEDVHDDHERFFYAHRRGGGWLAARSRVNDYVTCFARARAKEFCRQMG